MTNQNLSLEASRAILLTATEMAELGLDREYAASELDAMYGTEKIGIDFFLSVYDGALFIVRLQSDKPEDFND